MKNRDPYDDREGDRNMNSEGYAMAAMIFSFLALICFIVSIIIAMLA